MKRFPLLILVGLILIFISVLLPLFKYDVKEFHGLFSFKTRKTISRDVIMHGSQTLLTYLAIIASAIPVALFFIKQSKSRAYVLLIFSSVFSGLVILLYFSLTAKPSFYKGYYNVSLQIGFWSICVGAILITAGSYLTYKSHLKN